MTDEPDDDRLLLLAALEAAGATKVVVEYSGYGDSGDIEGVTATDDEGDHVELIMDVHEQVVDYTIELLERHYPGWEIDDGSTGELSIDVAEETFHLHHGSHYTATNWEDTAA